MSQNASSSHSAPIHLHSLGRGRLQAESTVPAPAGLPQPLTSLIGREADVAAAYALLAEGGVRLLTFTGPGGVGKTRLALAVAAASEVAFPDGVAFVPLAAMSDAAMVLPTIARTLEVRETHDRPLADVLIGVLQERRLLLVLDNFEHVLAAATDLAVLLAACPRLVLLVTSRAPLQLSGEQRYLTPPLTLPASGDNPALENLVSFGAIRLFVERARLIQHDFRIDTGNVDAVVEICRRLDGLPLAIELAAAWLHVLPPAPLLRQLERRLPLLRARGVDQPVRLRTMRDAVAWSYGLLSADEAGLFRRLAIFVGGFTLSAAEYVWAKGVDTTLTRERRGRKKSTWHSAPDYSPPSPASPSRAASPPSTLDLLAGLVDKSLLQQMHVPGPEPRFTMLETVREFAREQLADRGEDLAVADAHADYFLALAEQEAPDPCRHRDLMDRLELFDAEHANLRQAIEHLVRAKPEAALRLVGQLAGFWYLRSHFNAGRACFEQAVAAGVTASPAVRASALAGLGQMSLYQGDLDTAERSFDRALELAHTSGDRPGIAYARQGQAVLAMFRRDLVAAVDLGMESAALYESVGDVPHTMVGRFIAARALQYAGDLEEAAVRLEAILADFAGLPYPEALARTNLADVAARLGSHQAALTHYAAALELLLKLGERWNVATSLEGIASAFGALGKPQTAARLLGAAASLRAAIGTPLLQAELSELERYQTALIAALGESAFADAYAAGQELSPAAAVAEAVAAEQRLAPEEHRIARAEPLSPREREVLRLLVDGLSDKEIAATLGISRRTVSNHLAAIRDKLDVPSRAAAAAAAVRDHLV